MSIHGCSSSFFPRGPLFSEDGGGGAGGGAGGTLAAGAGGTGTPAAVPPSVPPSNQVVLTPEEYAKIIRERDTLKGRATELEELWGHTAAALDAEGDPVEKQNAVRILLQKTGKYTPDQINQMMGQATSKGRGRQEEEDEDEDGGPAATAAEQRLAALERQLQAQRVNSARDALDSEISRVFSDSSGPVGDLLKTVSTVLTEDAGPGAEKALRQMLRRQIDEETRRLLIDKRGQEASRLRDPNAWDNRWIAEMVPKAVESVLRDFRSVIPDPSKFRGRAGETDTAGLQEFLTGQPVPAPQGWDRDKDNVEASRTWANDYLTRGLAESQAARNGSLM